LSRKPNVERTYGHGQSSIPLMTSGGGIKNN
jgi:hypothetical protein